MITTYEKIYDSIQGAAHTVNQDRIFTIEKEFYSLFLIFDGVSNSQNPVQAIDYLANYIGINLERYIYNLDINFQSLIYEANQSLLNSGIQDGYTTFVGVFWSKNVKNQCIISSLGDSRAYLINNQSILKITRDDSLGEGSNILTKCLGQSNLLPQDIQIYSIQVGNSNILICSDGFYNLLEEKKKKIFKILNLKRLKTIQKNLKQELEYYKPQDDSSYLLININV